MPTEAYGRDYIFTIIPKNNNGEVPELEVIFNETMNVSMSESLQDISLLVGQDSFEWRKFYKFDTLIEKTPYDARYVQLDNYNDLGYKYNYKHNKSLLLNSILEDIEGGKTNIFYSTQKFENKKFKINTYEERIKDKFKLVYEIKFDKDEATKVFHKVYDNIWNNEEFASFFREDNDIQKKINVENNTKHILDILDNIKNNLTINELVVTITLNKDYPDSVILDFDTDYIVDGVRTSMNVGLSEFLNSMDDEYSPEDGLDIVSTTNFNELSK
jgi:hypothetical protein